MGRSRSVTIRATRCLPFLAALCSFALSSRAQDRGGSLSGVVLDPSGAVVQSANVQVRHIATGAVREASTDGLGAYRIPSLEPGEYRVTAGKSGFKQSVHDRVTIQLDRMSVVNHVLQVGDSRDSVLVAASPHSLEANSSVLSTVVEGATIEDLPLNGRDYLQLATLQAGAPPARAHARSVSNGYGLQISIAGSRPNQNSFRLDGITLDNQSGSTPGSINGVNLGVDAIQEFSLLSSSYSAQYGRAAGGIVNAVTRSGGNEAHGSLFYFHRNDNLDARNFFDGKEVPEFRRHQSGGSLGGPIMKNSAFFFVNYENLREFRGNTAINTTLSDSARQGRLISGTVPVDPIMSKAAALYPSPNGEIFGDTGLFLFQNVETGAEDFVTARSDLHRNDLDRYFLRYSFDDGRRDSATDFQAGRLRNTTRAQSAALENSRIFTPSVLNALRFGVLRTLSSFGNTTTWNPAADDPALVFHPAAISVGVLDVQGLTTFPGGGGSLEYGLYAFTSFQLSDDVSLTSGQHSVSFGVRLERTRFNSDNPNRINGEYRFRGIREFLTNVPDRLRAMVAGSDSIRGFRQWLGAAYFQDTWRVAPRFTIDLGVRYESASVPIEVNGKLANLDELGSPSLRVGAPLFDSPADTRLAPRVGFAWDFRGNGSTVLRGGYGIFPDLILSQYLLLAGLRNPPFFLRGSTTNLRQGDFPARGYLIFEQNPSAELRVERIPRSLRQPYVQHWNFNIEQVLDARSTVRLAYTGSRGVNLSSVTNDANLAVPILLGDGRLYFPADAPRLNPMFSAIRNRTFDASSFYHGFQAQFRHRMSGSLRTQLSYTFSKSMDDSSSYLATAESDNAIMLPLNGSPRFNRGLSAHDVRHYFAGSAIWRLSSPGTPVLGRLLGGWQMGAIVSYASGLPFSARFGYDAARTKTSTPDRQSGQRPDLAPGASPNPATGDPYRWVDLSAFLRPQDGFLGNLGRNTIIGPDMANTDFSVLKQMKAPFLGDSASLDFRAEFFNLFNRVNFDLPTPERTEVFNTRSTREDVARITTAGRSREIQFGLKLRF